MQTCLPMLAVHMLPFRGRVMLAGAPGESTPPGRSWRTARKLRSSFRRHSVAWRESMGRRHRRVCVVAQEHVEKAKKLETFLSEPFNALKRSRGLLFPPRPRRSSRRSVARDSQDRVAATVPSGSVDRNGETEARLSCQTELLALK